MNVHPSPANVASSRRTGADRRRERPSVATSTPFSASSVPQGPDARRGRSTRSRLPGITTAPREFDLPLPPPGITNTGPSTNSPTQLGDPCLALLLALFFGSAELGASVSRGRRRGVGGRLNRRAHASRGAEIVGAAHPFASSRETRHRAEGHTPARTCTGTCERSFPRYLRARQEIDRARDRVGREMVPRPRCPCTAASPSVISTARSSSTLPGYSVRRAWRNASASRTAAARAAPDSRSARASARHSSRSQYRPSTESRCSFAAASCISPRAWLDEVEQLVDEELPAATRRARLATKSQLNDTHVVATPLDRRVDESEHPWARCVRRRLARGERVRSLVGDHQSARRVTRPTDGRRRARRAPGLP